MGQHIDDLEGLIAVVQLYIDGAAGDPDKLRRAFDPQAQMFGRLGDQQHAIPIAGFIDLFAGSPASPAEEDYLGRDVVDFFSLARIDGDWKIVDETYAHTDAGARSRAGRNRTVSSRAVHCSGWAMPSAELAGNAATPCFAHRARDGDAIGREGTASRRC